MKVMIEGTAASTDLYNFKDKIESLVLSANEVTMKDAIDKESD
jgi:hypothetical protein